MILRCTRDRAGPLSPVVLGFLITEEQTSSESPVRCVTAPEQAEQWVVGTRADEDRLSAIAILLHACRMK